MYRGGVDAFFAVLITRLLSTGILAAVELIVLLLMFSEKSKIRILLEKNLKKII
jgi:hypothetical protein